MNKKYVNFCKLALIATPLLCLEQTSFNTLGLILQFLFYTLITLILDITIVKSSPKFVIGHKLIHLVSFIVIICIVNMDDKFFYMLAPLVALLYIAIQPYSLMITILHEILTYDLLSFYKVNLEVVVLFYIVVQIALVFCLYKNCKKNYK